jgi:DNA primase
MNVSKAWVVTVPARGTDWSEVKNRIDLATVATNLLGPARERKGNRLLWPCPFHEDHDPSFQVDLARKTWRCWTCAVGGDAAELVKLVNKCDFPTAVKFLAGFAGAISPPPGKLFQPAPHSAPVKAPARPSEGPTGLPLDEASSLVDESVRRLWEPGRENALAYLHGRGLTDETIRAAGLGFTPFVMVPTKAGDRCFRFSGIVIPWRDGTRLTRVKIRRIDDGKPKYAEAYSDRPRIFPDRAVIRPGKPLIICEGEFDALLLAQQLPEASVITLGSASARTDPSVLSRMLSAPRWFIALDADRAGDSAAAKFPARAVRVRPPGEFRDWTESAQAGVNLHRWWSDRLGGIDEPALFTWDELAALRWGPALVDQEEDVLDTHVAAEREAIQRENEP